VVRERGGRGEVASAAHARALGAGALRSLALAFGEPPAALLAPPAREDPLAGAYCPACHCEYRRSAGTCSSCRVGLVAFGCEAPRPTRCAAAGSS